MLELRDFVRLVLDPLRLAVLGGSVAAPADLEAIATLHERPMLEVQEARGKLRAAGLLTDELVVDRDALRALATQLPKPAAPDPEVLAGGEWSDGEVEILSRFFTGRRLKEVPGSRAKRLVILERLAQEFEPGLRYQEPEVNFTLQLWYADYATLRRYLVDEGFMTRADGVYWRTGGRFGAVAAD